ncbi:MAG: hypothetical protein PHS37_05675 [Candidatus Omnitrophica bacterium]|nr:hypothetical protein [Candidatus Omnitrophota bacterium]
MHAVPLSFYGINILFNSNNRELTGAIQRDFSFFVNINDRPSITVNAYDSIPPYADLPPMQARYYSPRNICYYNKGIKYVDYSGRGLVIYDKKRAVYDIYSADYPILYEICYMAMLSLVSERLDDHHIHRVHALGLAIDNKAILILLDMGGGKTTLAVQLLMSQNNIKLISEDSPLINQKGDVLPFPLRIGISPKDVSSQIPKEYQRYFERHECGPKMLVDIAYFKNKICVYPCQPHTIIVGRRVLGREPEIRPASRNEALREFFKNSVIGVGLYQGIEYIFQNGPQELIRKIPLGTSRLSNALKVINHSKIYNFYLGRDLEKNYQTLLGFLKKEFNDFHGI